MFIVLEALEILVTRVIQHLLLQRFSFESVDSAIVEVLRIVLESENEGIPAP